MQILQVILLRNFLTIQKNLEYLQCYRQYYKGINFREKILKFEKISSVSILEI